MKRGQMSYADMVEKLDREIANSERMISVLSAFGWVAAAIFGVGAFILLFISISTIDPSSWRGM